MEICKNKYIALFFSYNVSLNVWNELGMLSRERGIWDFFSDGFARAFFVSYGDDKEYRLLNYFPGIELLTNKWHLHPFIYSVLLPFLYSKELRQIDIYKVNQVSGSLPAIISKILYRKKLIIRCGYQLSLFFRKQKENWMKIFLALILEKIAFFCADLVIVSSAEDRKYIIAVHKVSPCKIKIIPNGIDTERFTLLPEIKKEPGRILFVGRLIPQKNLFALVDAAKGIPGAHLVIVGKGYLKNQLLKKVKQLNVNATFIDSVSNEDLPREYNKAEIFVLPSFFEGNPKVLLEAMACGLPVVATNVTGINNIIKNRTSGILCEPSSEGLRVSILELLSNKFLQGDLTKNARIDIEKTFSLRELIKKEIEEIANI